MLTGAKVVSGEVNRESRALEAEVECQHSVPEAAVTALEQLLQTHYDLRQIRLRFVSASEKRARSRCCWASPSRGSLSPWRG